MKVIIMLSCFVIASVAAMEKPVILCGRQLADTRFLLCYGVKYQKRTFSKLLEVLADGDIWSEDWPWKGRRGALSAGWERYKRDGLADECCLKPCTTDVIRSYC